jgi:hypothetical protein
MPATLPQFIVRINANLSWRFTIGKGGHYVAVCDPLKLTLQANTWAELMEDTADVLNVVFIDLLKANELNPFLQQHGWNIVGGLPRDPKNVRFDVPFFFVPQMAQAHDSSHYASK